MNDFTKDELFNLYVMTCAWVGYNNDDQPSVNLQNKIRTLIDNYCEHEYYLNGCGENVIAQCHKCGHIGEIELNE